MYETNDDTQLPTPVADDPWDIPEPLDYWTLDDFPDLPMS